jgi:hypothetical protein
MLVCGARESNIEFILAGGKTETQPTLPDSIRKRQNSEQGRGGALGHERPNEGVVMSRDFIGRNLGVRVFDNECAVIEQKPGVRGWVEGERLPLPLPPGFDNVRTIPASRIGQALRAYESQNPVGDLRELLTRKPKKEE